MAANNNSSSSVSNDMKIITSDIDNTMTVTTEPTSNNTQHTLNDISKIEKQVTNEHSFSSRDSSTTPKIYSQRKGTLRHIDTANNLANNTLTIVIERSKPLILRLQNPEYSLLGYGSAIIPESDIETAITTLGDKLVAHVTEAVNTIRDEVKRARPCPGEENYEQKIVVYQELVACITHILKTLTNVFNDSLTQYRVLIDQLWNDIQHCQSQTDIQHCAQKFLHQAGEMFRNAVANNIEPLFKDIESKLNPPEQ